ncbi:hypothetical protein BGZ96_004242 [Linnemannia gamsii]|uniref:SLC26A/SulP transporter domain-containing protein n=1 Tax=Linnemannia gamsii TaxID=64522 RepID=A0ABQ7KJT5_9FUNG|nr:hypothetical protein BGZ96_004242 [Linnemannia gamsii]
MSPPALPGTPPSQENHATRPNEAEYAQEVLLNPDLLNPPPSSPSPLLSSTAVDSTLSSRASSVHGASASSIISESGESFSSLGGLNHVNDGVGGSTVQRRMSRAYSSLDDDLLQQAQLQNVQQQQQQQQPQPRRRFSIDPIIIDTAATALTSPAGQRRASSLPSSTIVDEDGVLQMETKQESCFKTWLRRRVPVFGWLISPGYNLNDLPDDLIAGITISTVVIPQSMAYAMLAPLPPVYGLYTSVVPILIYCLFGTSRHMHTGTFAITTLLLGQAVRGLMAKDVSADILASNDYSLASTLLYDSTAPTSIEDPEYEQRFIGMILMLSFVVGCLQVILSFLRVGGWASKHLLPDALVGGFNTAAVFHIGTSQLKHFLGLKNMPSPQGAFALIKSWIWIGQNFWAGTNWYTVGLGSIAILMMLAMRKVERKRKAAFELKLRKEEMFLVQQRQAISAAIVRSHEEQREQQRQWQQQQQQKGGDAGVGPSTGGPLSPYQDASPNQSALASNISLRTVAHEDDESNRPGPSISFAPVAASATAARTPGQVEQALSDPTVPVASAKDRPVYIPIPDILLAVIILTIINVVFSLDTPRSKGGMGIAVIGSIPKGLPQMAFPANLVSSGPKEWLSLEFLQRVILPMVQPALLIAVIIFVMSFSIAKQFGKRYGYKVDANQEMMALGLASMGGSIFSGYACTGSLTRTAILAQSGGKTPLASIVGVITVTLTLICLTWCFERVPNTVLAAIVLVALQSLVMQITEPLKLWRLGQRKASVIWTMTFLGVLIISVELGIAIGIAVVLLATIFGWATARYRGEDNSDRDALLQRQRRRSSTAGRRLSQGAAPDLDTSARRAGGPEDATESLLNHSASASSANGLASAGAGGSQQQRRRPQGSGVHLSAPASPPADWKRKMMRTKWGQRIGSFLGMEQPIFSDSLHTNTDEDDY